MLTTCDKRRHNYQRINIRVFCFTSLEKILIFSCPNILFSVYLLYVPPVMVQDPLADGCTDILLRSLRGNEGEIIRSYLHTSHITGPTRPISTTPLPSQTWRKLDFR